MKNLIVDDEQLARDRLARMLGEIEGCAVVGQAANGMQAVERCSALEPDLVLMDIRMPGMDGVEATRRLRARWPEARVIILTTFDDDTFVFEGLRTLLELEPGFEVAAEAGDGQAALEAYAAHQPDVVLMDIRMPGMDGVEI